MHLKSLTVKGFKSFADQVRLELGPGVTAIVGPNGSGKSNLADAVRWVLGEQAVNPLRASSAEDLIFSGTSDCPPSKAAEVILSLDNSSSFLPVESDNVSVGRRVLRSGESEYLMNRSPCRLRDLQELLADARLGRGLTSIIGQGRIEEVLSAKAADRRLYIEEIAGTLKYRHRKARALRKLERVEANILRARDVVAEVKRQIKPLEAQADRMRVYEQLTGELKDLELRAAVERLKEFRRAWDKAAQAESEQKQAGAAAARLLDHIEGNLRDLGAEMGSREDRLTAGKELQGRNSALLERIHGLERFRQEKQRGIERRYADMSERLAEAHSQLSHLSGEPTRAENIEQVSVEDQQAELEHLLRVIEDKRAAQKHHFADIQTVDRRIVELRHNLELLESDLAAAPDRDRQRSARREAVRQELATANDRLKEAQRRSTELEQDRERLVEVHGRETSHLAIDEQTLQLLDEAAFKLRESLSASREELASLRGKRQALERMASSGSRSSSHQADLGELAELCRARPDLEPAIDNLLGDLLFARVVRSSESLPELALALKEGEQAKATLLALDLLADLPSIKDDPVRPLAAGIEFEGEAAGLENAFSASYLVTDLPAALDLARKHGPAYSFVTPDGETVGPGGFVRLGQKNGESKLSLHRELKDLAAQEQRLAERVALQEEELLKTEADQHSARVSVERRRIQAETWRREQARLNSLAGDIEREGRSSKERRETLLRELASFDEESKIAALRIGDLEKKRDEHRGQMARARDEQAGLKAKLEPIGDEVANLERRSAELTAQMRLISSRLAEQEAKERRGREAAARLETLISGLCETGSALRRTKERLNRLGDLLARLRSQTEQVGRLTSERWSEEREALLSLKSKYALSKREHDQARIGCERSEEAIHKIELRITELKLQVDLAVSKITEEHETPLDVALALPALDKPLDICEARCRKLRERIQRLGAVNPAAYDEHMALKERYEFLCGQITDLEAGRRELLRLIGELDRKVRETFMSAFERVVESFADLVDLLFSGGRGRLSLTGEDILEAGVEIQVELPGKRLTRLSAMSGGERALAALAFSFALYRANPAPFCLLDEVDAALDDANLGKFAGLLERYKGESQFIVITHQKRTMKAADLLYGVSLQPNGASTVISQRV